MNSKTREQHAWRKKRQRAESRFQWFGRGALGVAVLLIVALIGSILGNGYYGFMQTNIRLNVVFDAAILEVKPGDELSNTSPSAYLRLSHEALKAQFPQVTERKDRRELYDLLSVGVGAKLRRALLKSPELLGKSADIWLPTSSAVDLFVKRGKGAKLTQQQHTWLETLQSQDRVRTHFNSRFFTSGDSRTPEQAGFLGSALGSAYTLIICLLIAFPLGVMTAVYLEEFAKKGRLVDIIEVNINNLAAVPSIVFGLLGLSIYINVIGLPRSAPLVGGMTLALMILPVIIIATRAALNSIPSSIRDAARGLGASPVQVVWHHVLPLAMPGIMTGTILGLARAIGETAPLIMIGMVAFVADLPTGFASPATVMPVQIYLWANSPEAGFAEKTAAGILALLVLLLAMNALAIYLRKRFEVRW